MMLHDAHFHLQDRTLLKEIHEHNIQGIVNAQNPAEYTYLKQCLHNTKGILISAGIHPWDADNMKWEEMEPIMAKAEFIGEIGLDNVWCDVDQNRQMERFERSLDYATRNHKPVILHTKGMERAVLSCIQRYENHYLVHWYSCMEYMDAFIDLGCYFTIGPSVTYDPAVRQVAKLLPCERLMIESDGLDALSWCEKRTVKPEEYSWFLKRSIQEIAKIKGLSENTVTQILNQSFAQFCSFVK